MDVPNRMPPMQATLASYLATSQPLYRAAQVRQVDSHAIERLGIPGLALMERAGAASFKVLQRRWPDACRVAVLCGAGNNGGDGYVVARLIHLAGLSAVVYALASPERLKGDAWLAYQAFREASGRVENGLPDRLDPAALLVDGLLGTGLDRPVEGVYAQAIAAINASGCRVLALDIPSGLSADTGMPLGDAVRADVTVTFIALKRGLYTGLAAEHCGAVELAGLDLPCAAREVAPAEVALLQDLPSLPPRPRCAHKGHHGHVLAIGGDSGNSGAVRMAAEAAARAGAGLVSVATRAAHAATLNLGRPELMCHGVESPEQLRPLLDRASVLLLGPGLGQSNWARALLDAALAASLPMVVDADALNLLAAAPRQRRDWVLTPHPGEAGRMLASTSGEVQRDRYAAAAALQGRYGGVVVLKGSGSLIRAEGGVTYVSNMGNPGMASGGMGDVLAGVVAGLMAQGVAHLEAAAYATVLHGAAGDLAAKRGERGLLAGDLMNPLRELLNR